MKFSTIRIEGAILSADILDKIEEGELGGQSPKDFGFDSGVKVKDEIARAWADAQDQWRIFKRHKENVPDKATGTTETRKYFILPLLGFLGYNPGLSGAEEVNGKLYAISHRASNLDRFPLHIMGFNDSLDKKRQDSGPRMSPHALVQEYLNLTEHLYAIVTNGLQLRLRRDSSRLIKLSYIEFNLESMMEDEHFADFAIMYRLLHASRMPEKYDSGAESKIEKYHQDALDSGSRIREGLSKAVENSIVSLANGFLQHPKNEEFRNEIHNGYIEADKLYQNLLRLIYRLLFLMVIEERNLIYPKKADKRKRDIYYNYYSISNLRRLCEKRYLRDRKYDNLWMSLKNTFRLFDDEYRGSKLDLKPLGGELFSNNSIGALNNCRLDNEVLLECLKNLSVFTNKKTGQKMRVNYGSLNVEEFGSVYESLLERDPMLKQVNGYCEFELVKGEGRSVSGSHYTPDELVQPLIKHSLDYIIEDKLKESNPEEALLSIKVCDVACGSGHILLNAARRIGIELAKVRTGEDQPSPVPLRIAIRDVIKSCIYGVDKNPLAVELCKVALWLEAHNPGEPLNFFDHHIKCGDSIVGLAHKEELENGIATEAFKTLPGDDKDVAALFRKLNKEEINTRGQLSIQLKDDLNKNLESIADFYGMLNRMPEHTPEEVETKQNKYNELSDGREYYRLKLLADTQVAQFFIPKTDENKEKLVADATYQEYLTGESPMQGSRAIAKAEAVAVEKSFFHWFLEFPEIFAKGGFDCILGNPPFLGGSKISGTYGKSFLNYLQKAYYPTNGLCDLVGYFVRRNYQLIRDNRILSLISTNTICQGATKISSLDFILENNGEIIFVIKSIKWPGLAAVYVSLFALCKGDWSKDKVLNNKKVDVISSLFDDGLGLFKQYNLFQNNNKGFLGVSVNGLGFFISRTEAKKLIEINSNYKDVLFPYITGEELYNDPHQKPGRWVINFFDWSIEKAKKYVDCFKIVEEKVKPERLLKNDKISKEKWWLFLRMRPEMRKVCKNLNIVLVVTRASKTLAFCFKENNIEFADRLVIIASDKFFDFTIMQSSIHNVWAWKFGTTLKTDLIYNAENVFETFPFPQNISKETESELEKIGEEYHDFRRQLMLKIQRGLTKTYNLFHTKNLTVEAVEKASKLERNVCEEAYQDILTLRRLHKEMDEAVLHAYGWEDVDLAHDFYEVDYLPENDRLRYTISPDARKEILKHLLKLNHKIHEQEVAAGLWDKKKSKSKSKKISDPNQKGLEL
ncbi:MAG TPA: restriction endonuclease [bacterium]|nr:restriction endonuclease [bacterium]